VNDKHSAVAMNNLLNMANPPIARRNLKKGPIRLKAWFDTAGQFPAATEVCPSAGYGEPLPFT
jgi:hypothetical protein